MHTSCHGQLLSTKQLSSVSHILVLPEGSFVAVAGDDVFGSAVRAPQTSSLRPLPLSQRHASKGMADFVPKPWPYFLRCAWCHRQQPLLFRYSARRLKRQDGIASDTTVGYF